MLRSNGDCASEVEYLLYRLMLASRRERERMWENFAKAQHKWRQSTLGEKKESANKAIRCTIDYHTLNHIKSHFNTSVFIFYYCGAMFLLTETCRLRSRRHEELTDLLQSIHSHDNSGYLRRKEDRAISHFYFWIQRRVSSDCSWDDI